MRASPIDTEVEFYRRKRDELVAKADGKFVLIKGENIAGTYDTLDEALTAGYERFGLEPFLARQIATNDETINMTSLLLSP